MTKTVSQYYVKVSGGTVNGKSADWLNPGNNTFKPNAKASVTDTAWSGQTSAVVGNIRYHKKYVYTPKNKVVNITGPTTVTITASDYTETIEQSGKQQYKSTSVTATYVSASASGCTWQDGKLYIFGTDSWGPYKDVKYTYKKPDGSSYVFTKGADSVETTSEPYWKKIETHEHGEGRKTYDWELKNIPNNVTTTQNGWVNI